MYVCMYVYIYIHLLSCSFHGTNRTVPNSHSLALEVIEQRKFLLQPSAASPAKAARSAWISKRSRGKLMVIWYHGDIMGHIINNMIYTIYIGFSENRAPDSIHYFIITIPVWNGHIGSIPHFQTHPNMLVLFIYGLDWKYGIPKSTDESVLAIFLLYP